VVRLPALYAIVDPLDTGRDPVALAQALLAGGARCLQLRLKAASAHDVLLAARAIAAHARAAGALFFVNDRADLARAAGADGVHLGQEDLPPAAARRVLGPGKLVGVSTHDLDELHAAVAAGADYVGVGPIHATTSKANPLAPRGLALLHAARAATSCPIVAIGGLGPANARDARDAGADAVAMIGALVRAADPAAAVRDTLAALGVSA
jgi:thiamine-phosphate pyrophosphorylase